MDYCGEMCHLNDPLFKTMVRLNNMYLFDFGTVEQLISAKAKNTQAKNYRDENVVLHQQDNCKNCSGSVQYDRMDQWNEGAMAGYSG